MGKFNPIIEVEKDEFSTPEVRQWSLEKFRLVGTYCDIFTAGMRNKWDQLVYVDLFAGAGHARIKETNKIYRNSAFSAMSIPVPFTKYILCEEDEERLYALEKRVARDFGHLDVSIVAGDSNANIKKIKETIPKYGKGNTLLPFCFVDPYSLNLHFSTIETLASGLMDFLILQALHMDANRNLDRYIKTENSKIGNYLGIADWRNLFEEDGPRNRRDFIKFLADQYQKQMSKMGYQSTKHMHQIRSNDKNLPLYYLAFFSKHERGEDFFKKVQARVTDQLSFF